MGIQGVKIPVASLTLLPVMTRAFCSLPAPSSPAIFPQTSLICCHPPRSSSNRVTVLPYKGQGPGARCAGSNAGVSDRSPCWPHPRLLPLAKPALGILELEQAGHQALCPKVPEIQAVAQPMPALAGLSLALCLTTVGPCELPHHVPFQPRGPDFCARHPRECGEEAGAALLEFLA